MGTDFTDITNLNIYLYLYISILSHTHDWQTIQKKHLIVLSTIQYQEDIFQIASWYWIYKTEYFIS